MRLRAVVAAASLVTLVAACASSANPIAVESNRETHETDETNGTNETVTEPGEDPFGWQEVAERTEVGKLEVPIDRDDPSAGTFELSVARHLADPDQRIGSLLVNPGGPGFGGSDYGLYADQVYSEDLVAHFDIIGWDPRGTGESTPAIDCIDEYDPYFATTDITPDDDEERRQAIEAAEELEDLCASKNADILQHVGTNDSARDMDAIRLALGEAQISYFGFSYGSELGATWATLYPDTVRAAVLDGAADPNADNVTGGLQQIAGFEASINEFLAQCSKDSDCAFHSNGGTVRAFDDLMLSLDDEPVPSSPGRPPVNLAIAIAAAIEAMYSDSDWPVLAQALADAQGGDGAGLLSLYDRYYQRRDDGTYDNSLEAFQTISCMDDATRLTVEEEDELAPQFTAVAPRLAPNTIGSYQCTFFPPARHPRVDITGDGAGPILVVGTTGDPSTPLASSRNMAAALEDGVLLVVVANQHTGYGVNQCSYDRIDGYLIDLDVPEDGTRCG